MFEEGTAVLSGVVEDYRGIYRTGKLSWFDAVTRLPRDEVFDIDEEGRFTIELELVHPLVDVARLDLEGSFHTVALAPGEHVEITVLAGGIRLVGDAAARGRGAAAYARAAAVDLADEAARAEGVHGSTLTFDEAADAYAAHAAARLEHLSSYVDHNSMEPSLRRLLELDVLYGEAHARICYRYASSGGRVGPRPGLPADYLERIRERFPLGATDALGLRSYIDYLANVAQALEESGDDSVEARLAFYASVGVFGEADLELLDAVYRGDRAVMQSEAFAAFDTAENRRAEFLLRRRFDVKLLLDGAAALSPGLGRDLVVSQGVARNYLAGDPIAPGVLEWARIEELVTTPEVVRHLRREFDRAERGTPSDVAEPRSDAEPTGDFDAILRKSRGKVVYVDFWATWCAPCRVELPDTKRLLLELEGEDVVFLAACVESDEGDWSRMIAQKDPGGEQVFLTDAEFEPLARRYGVKGYPTYVLIDRAGDVVDRNAPRPSSGDEIVRAIRALLQ